MKKYLIAVLAVLLLLAVTVLADVPFSNQILNIGAENGSIIVSGAFDACNKIGENYRIYLATYSDNGILKNIDVSENFTVSEGSNTFKSTFKITDKNQHTKAFVLTEDLTPVCKNASKTVRSLKLLSIGNSFSVDAQAWLYEIAKDAGIDNVVLGNLYIGGCSLKTHSDNATSNNPNYTYYKEDNKSATDTTTNVTMLSGIIDEDWDYITLQQNSGNSGYASTYETYLTNLINYVNDNKTNPDAELIWHMTWAYNNDYSATSSYQTQQAMYDGIINAVKEKIDTNNNISFVIPVGTAIQNARTSFLGDTFNRDGYHLEVTYGRYLAGLTWFSKITGLPVEDIDYIPNNSFTNECLKVLKESVINAIQKPYEITQSQYTKSENSLDDLVLIDWEPKVSSYFDSRYSSDVVSGTEFTKKYISSKIFTRETLPVGSVIVLDSGYQYRPDGWTSLDAKTADAERPGNVTTAKVVVTEEWWVNFNYRAFNLSKKDTSNIDTIFDEVKTHLKIYVPKSAAGEQEIPSAGYIDWEPHKSSYYNSSNSGAIISGTDLDKMFICSKIFTRKTLPVGSVIVVDEGYRYRPEGWVSLDSTNTSSQRPGNVSESCVVVTEEWWGDFNYRAFNLAKIDSSNIDTIFDEAKTHLTIYVPQAALEGDGYTDLEDGKLIDWKPINSTYYNSLSSSTAEVGTKLGKQFVCSKIFTKEELPVETVIEIDSGYRYRPEGWTSLDAKNESSKRPGNVSTSSVTVTEEWWGDFNYRAFNISKTDGSDISADFAATVSHFRIILPE